MTRAPIAEGVWMHHANDDDGHTTDGGRVSGIDRFAYAECADYGCSQVVVISPRVQGSGRGYDFWLRDAAATLRTAKRNVVASILTKLADQIEEQTRTEPPKPDEPTGLGAVVEDDKGERYVRYDSDDVQPWWHQYNGPDAQVVVRRYSYSDFHAVRILSEGITP